MLKYHLLALLIGIIADLIVGDPHGLWHPVRTIGWLIHKMDIALLGEGSNSSLTCKSKRARGLLLVLVVLISTFLISAGLVYFSYSLNIWLGVVVEAVISCYCLATKSLIKESGAVIKAYDNEGIEKSRYALSMIVGRDTKNLNLEQIIKATIETIAENASDGVFAPLFYLFFLGPVGGMCYKAINTMDSMIAYKNDRYLDFGRVAAKLDDVANFIPSRITALLTIFTAFLFSKKYDYKAAFRIFKRDRYKSTSPNSAQSEASFAGALNVQLGGGASYFGVFHEKPFLGDRIKELEKEDVARAQKLLFRMMMVCVFFLGIILLLMCF